jgi:hypothetical protein
MTTGWRSVFLFLGAAVVFGEGKKMTRFYIIPKQTQSCLPSYKEEAIYIDPDQFSITNSQDKSVVLEFPGCVDIKAQVQLLKPLPSNLMMYDEWQWLQAPPNGNFSDLACKNTSANGCGGVGNRCFYCDACNQLDSVQTDHSVRQTDRFNCPTTTGIYQYRNKLCINDWGDLDKNGDGEPDFLSDAQFQDYKNLLDVLQVKGYGTMRLRFMLAHNATETQEEVKKRQEEYITQAIQLIPDDEFQRQLDRLAQLGWRPSNSGGSQQQRRQSARADYAQYRVDTWHRVYWLPRLLQENLMACVTVAFDVCDRRPNPSRVSSNVDSACS